MTPSSAKRKGRDTENAVVAFLQDNGWPHAERRRLNGTADRGDIAGSPGVCWEVKSSDQERGAAMREAERERETDGADVGVVVERRRGYPAGDWYATVPLGVMCRLLRECGYGDDASREGAA